MINDRLDLHRAIGALSSPFGISPENPNMDMTSRTQQRFGALRIPEGRERDRGTRVGAIAPALLIAPSMVGRSCRQGGSWG